MSGWPKPAPRIKTPKPLRRGKPIARSRKRIKQTNAYSRPEWRKLCRQVKKRSKGICEIQTHCDGDLAVGDPHHAGGYVEDMVGPDRILVDLDTLLAACRRCHLAAHGNPEGLYA